MPTNGEKGTGKWSRKRSPECFLGEKEETKKTRRDEEEVEVEAEEAEIVKRRKSLVAILGASQGKSIRHLDGEAIPAFYKTQATVMGDAHPRFHAHRCDCNARMIRTLGVPRQRRVRVRKTSCCEAKDASAAAPRANQQVSLQSA